MRSLRALLRFHSSQAARLGPLEDLVVGEVDLWGYVAGPAPGDDMPLTLRAQHASIVGPLYIGSNHAHEAKQLAERYEVTVTEQAELVA